MTGGILAHAVVVAAYAAAGWLSWRALRPSAAGPAEGLRAERLLVPVALTAHAALLAHTILTPGGPDLGFGNALALVAWLSTLIAWIMTLLRPQPGLLAMLLPASAVAAAIPLLMHVSHEIGAAEQPVGALHVAIALVAYAMFVVAVLQAIVLLWLERRLHTGALGSLPTGVPPLLTLERFVFQLTTGAFLMLTLTLASGMLFTETLFGQPLRFNHKTVFSILAWLVFAALLLGRARYGWRGRVALRWLLAGSVLLLLAYLGTKFVLEVLLGR
jgi:ABC-type uncharacterized transport system permease subunit